MKINKNTVLIGSDFEMFLVNKEGKAVSAIPFIHAGKNFPEKTSKHGCCIQHDGVLAECNVPPVGIQEWNLFVDNISYVKGYIEEKFAKKEGLNLVCCPSMELEESQLTDPEATESGCMESYNAWLDGEANPKCNFGGSKVRTCGAHIHFSFEGANIENCIELMKVFDIFLTIPFLFMDGDDRRKQFYGKAGEMRLCDWGETRGFEARTLSNFWINDERYIEYVFGQIEKMFDYYNENGISKINDFASDVIEAINNNNKEVAGKICDEFGLLILIDQPA